MNDEDKYKEIKEREEQTAHEQFMQDYIDYYDRRHGYYD